MSIMVYLRAEFHLQARNLLFTFAYLHSLKIFKSFSLLTFSFSVCLCVYKFKFIFSDINELIYFQIYGTYKNYKTLMKIITIIKGKEGMNLDKSEVGGYMRGFEVKKGKKEMIHLYYYLKNKKEFKKKMERNSR